MNLMRNAGLLLLRIGFSALMIVQHGWNKWMGFENIAPNFPDPLGVGSTFSLALAVAGEVLFPALVLVGFYTRLSSIPVVVTMGVAAFIVHAGDGLGDRESALMYLIGFAVIGLMGPGRFSIDHLRKVQ